MADPTSHSAERVLIVDDDPATRNGLTELVRAWGFTAESAGDGAEALERVTDFRPSIIVSDMVMPKMSGLDLLKALTAEVDNIKVILLTAQGTVDTAVEAVKAGAEDYLTKPLDPHKLQRLLERLAEINQQKRENQVLRRQLTGTGRFGRIIGHSAAMRALYQVLEQAAPTPASMLLLGESGTGKELVAQTIHQLSPRLAAPFIALNCAAIPEALLESELFGHTKGAFTGAQANKIGKFEAADGGTLFLDEIGDMALSLQAKILRVLQEGVIEPVGSNKTKDIDVRIVAATNRNLAQMVQEGKFREDLYYRLNVIVLELPALRERPSDVPKLLQHFLEKCRTAKTALRGFSPDALTVLKAYGWPGNIRELENTVLRMTLLCSREVAEPEDVRPLLEGGARLVRPGTGAAATVATADAVRKLDDMEREAIAAALTRFEGSRISAAQALGISVRKLQYKIKEYQQAGIPID